MNVRVDLNAPIKDGQDVVFRAPCGAAEVTGLTVYYPVDGVVESQTFAFADAHANDLGDLDNLFDAGGVVKVILDLETGKAFVQNADTNAYLEGKIAEMARLIAAQASGVYNILEDNKTGLIYRLYVEDGQLKMAETASGTAVLASYIVDEATGLLYRLYVENGNLKMEVAE